MLILKSSKRLEGAILWLKTEFYKSGSQMRSRADLANGAIGRSSSKVKTISSGTLSLSTNYFATFRSSSFRISEESNVQSVAVAVSTLEAETHEFLLSRSDPPFIYTFGHEEDF